MKSVICVLLCSVLVNAGLAGIDPLLPQDGAVVPILSAEQKDYLATPTEKRVDARIYPVRDRIECESLNGTWDLQIDEGPWVKAIVPGTWENQGLKRAEYSTFVPATHGRYRRTLAWNAYRYANRRVIIRFDGVMYGFEFFVNGTKVGEADSAYNLSQFDVTDELKEGDNVLEVLVKGRVPHAGFDQCDDWAFVGITRDVTLFTVGDNWFKDFDLRTTLSADGSADLALRVFLDGLKPLAAGSRLKVALLDGAGQEALGWDVAAKDGLNALSGVVRDPDLWTAETPNLYRLQMLLFGPDGQLVQRLVKEVGLKEVRVEGVRLLVNGQPVLLRGVCLNETDPKHGRAFTRDDFRRRLESMKRANINFIRTAHYPFAPSFYEECSRIGFYVADEIPYSSGGRHNLGKLETLPYMIDRATRTVRRDKNEACVTLWSVGNENPYPEQTLGPVLDLIKELDPTRPRYLPHPKVFGSEALLRDFLARTSNRVDICSIHYAFKPTLDFVRSICTHLPILQSEYAHARGNAFSSFEWSQKYIYDHEQMIGGSIWHWHDHGILQDETQMDEFRATGRWPSRYSKSRFKYMRPEHQGVWTDPRHFIDSYGGYGTDGITCATGWEKEAYWLVRKLYSPIQFDYTNGVLKGVSRYDFLSAHGHVLDWRVVDDLTGAVRTHGEVPLSAPARSTFDVPLALGETSRSILRVRVLGPNRLSMYENAWRLDETSPSRAFDFPQAGSLSVASSGEIVWTVGERSVTLPLLLKAHRQPSHHVLRGRSQVEMKGATEDWEKKEGWNIWDDWMTNYLSRATEVSVERCDGTDVVRARWYKDGDKTSASYFDATLQVRPAARGGLKVDYELAASAGLRARPLELGLGFDFGTELRRVDWDGIGPWSSNDGKSQHNAPGLFALDRDDIRFDGVRQKTRRVFVSDGSRGLAFDVGDGRVNFENAGGHVVLMTADVMSPYGDFKGPNVAGRSWTGAFELRPCCAKGAPQPLRGVAPVYPFTSWYGW